MFDMSDFTSEMNQGYMLVCAQRVARRSTIDPHHQKVSGQRLKLGTVDKAK
jgi:hypothetical protein